MVERSTMAAMRRSHPDHHSYFGEARRHGLDSKTITDDARGRPSDYHREQRALFRAWQLGIEAVVKDSQPMSRTTRATPEPRTE